MGTVEIEEDSLDSACVVGLGAVGLGTVGLGAAGIGVTLSGKGREIESKVYEELKRSRGGIEDSEDLALKRGMFSKDAKRLKLEGGGELSTVSARGVDASDIE